VSPNAGSPIEYEHGDAGKLLATMEKVDAHQLEDAEDSSIEQSDNTLVRLINSMIVEAHSQNVSDIHIECQPGKEKVRVRFRKDGQMRPYMELPPNYRSALLARLKIMCDLDISERRKPQDGKINFSKFVQGVRLELRVATIPTQGGLEDAVLRLLASSKPIPLDNLGLSPVNLERLRTAAQRPYGMLLCVGPTGSGKTTTLHSLLSSINTPERKIWTAEDPVEITQAGLRQVQVNPRIEWTFARALRSFLRADPDVIMVGEIRDEETAHVAIEASLTGHLVLSTLHTNSAPETVTRLLDMGMDPFNFADALLGVLAQRLVRRVCQRCRTARDASPEEVEELLQDYMHVMEGAQDAPAADDVLAEWRRRFGTEGRLTLYKGIGCEHCSGSGFRGRAGIHELMMISRGLRHLIQTGARADDLQKHALGDGMRSLRQDGIEKVLAGVTTIEEVRASS
jgi:type II secretory ATPase GspE/PulE/Tfp pilus assembly ATPase PilB-like protein